VIGKTCAVKEDCASTLTCVISSSFIGGYCSNSCSDDSFCPDGSWCAPKALAGTSQSMCAKSCTIDADCRTAEGYSCVEINPEPSKKGCLPATP
jgi:hypothetical protein